MHENFTRPGPAVNEPLCQPSPRTHRLVSANPKNAPTFHFSVTFRDEPKVLVYFHFPDLDSDIVKASPATTTPEVCLCCYGIYGNTTVCLPTAFRTYFVLSYVLATSFFFFDRIEVSTSRKMASRVSQYKFNVF